MDNNLPTKQPSRKDIVADYFSKPENLARLKSYFKDDESKAAKFNQTLMMIAMDEKYQNYSPQSIFKCGLYAAELDLSPQKNLGLVYFVPRKNKKTKTVELCFDIGYRGWLTMLDRGEKSCKAYPVYECDLFSIGIDTSTGSGWDEKIIYKPLHEKWNEASSEWVKDNLKGVLVMILDHRRGVQNVKYVKRDVLDKIRSMSPSAESEYSPWNNWTSEMYMAKAIKYVASKTSMDDKTARAVEIENMFHVMNQQHPKELSPLERDLSGGKLLDEPN